MDLDSKLILAISKGRVLEEFLDFIKGTKFSLIKEPENTRKILVDTNTPHIKVLLVRGWDVPTYVTSGAAHLGIVGKDILMEKNSEEFIELRDLRIGNCRILLAGKGKNILKKPKLKVATKYPFIAKKYLSTIGIQSDIIYLHGSQEIAPDLGLADVVIDIVDSGRTLKENNLKEIKLIKNISTRLIVNKAALKTKDHIVDEFISKIDVSLRD